MAKGSRTLWLSYMSNLLLNGSNGGVASCQRSGIMNGLTHVAAFACEASAVALAPISTVGTPKIGPMRVGMGLSLATMR